jgi:hypothetical protein
MKTSFEVADNVIVRRFNGDITQEDIIESWRELFSSYNDLSSYSGIVMDLLHARLMQDRKKFGEMVGYVKGKRDQLTDLKIAFLMDTPQVTQIILMDHMIHQLQIRPFATMKGALDWIKI